MATFCNHWKKQKRKEGKSGKNNNLLSFKDQEAKFCLLKCNGLVLITFRYQGWARL